MKTVLVTGFEPFGGEVVNPAQESVRKLGTLQFENIQVHTLELPVVKSESVKKVVTAIDRLNPDVVLLVGQAEGRVAINIERVAINIDDYPIADNDGNHVVDEPVIEGGPTAYFSTLPIKAIVAALQEQKVPAVVSNSAGTFVCNHLFYSVRHYLEKRPIKVGFIHVPLLDEQALNGKRPSMSLDTIVKGLQIAIDTVAQTTESSSP